MVAARSSSATKRPSRATAVAAMSSSSSSSSRARTRARAHATKDAKNTKIFKLTTIKGAANTKTRMAMKTTLTFATEEETKSKRKANIMSTTSGRKLRFKRKKEKDEDEDDEDGDEDGDDNDDIDDEDEGSMKEGDTNIEAAQEEDDEHFEDDGEEDKEDEGEEREGLRPSCSSRSCRGGSDSGGRGSSSSASAGKSGSNGSRAGLYPIGTAIRKDFGTDAGGWYRGVIDSYDADSGYYGVLYDDGDREDVSVGGTEVDEMVRNASFSDCEGEVKKTGEERDDDEDEDEDEDVVTVDASGDDYDDDEDDRESDQSENGPKTTKTRSMTKKEENEIAKDKKEMNRSKKKKVERTTTTASIAMDDSATVETSRYGRRRRVVRYNYDDDVDDDDTLESEHETDEDEENKSSSTSSTSEADDFEASPSASRARRGNSASVNGRAYSQTTPSAADQGVGKVKTRNGAKAKNGGGNKTTTTTKGKNGNKKTATAKNKKGKSKSNYDNCNDESSFSDAMIESSSDDLLLEEIESDEDFLDVATPKRRRSTRASTKASTTSSSAHKMKRNKKKKKMTKSIATPKPKTTNKRTTKKVNQDNDNNDADDADDDDDDDDDGGTKKSMAESFMPTNAPIYPKLSRNVIAKTKSFLDPCGMEATDDIIGGLIAEQVRKIGGLLRRALGDGDVKAEGGGGGAGAGGGGKGINASELPASKKRRTLTTTTNGKNGSRTDKVKDEGTKNDDKIEGEGEGEDEDEAFGSSVATIGSASHPLRLGTACSGTDAPALALNLVVEQMERLGLTTAKTKTVVAGTKRGGDAAGASSPPIPLLRHQHVFSCEVDPFKQAYLARNFDSALYPDIAKLSCDDPRDVYGQIRPLPQCNLFVAGTSCKNFSMLMSKRRLDIEDKGCSGETFLAACEVLFREKPRFAILENVQSAPWEKMSEYITGRVKLSSCASNKAIKNVKDRNKELEFAWLEEGDDDEEDDDDDKEAAGKGQGKAKNKSGGGVGGRKRGSIVAHRVPAVYGVRCGAAVRGFLSPGSDGIIKEAVWPANRSSKGGSGGVVAGATCTLADLMKANGANKDRDTLVFDVPAVYCTKCVKVDSKDYGLPQTRNRTYMFVWRPEKNGDGEDRVDDDLGIYLEAAVRYLRSPVRHSLEAFVLNADHDIIRAFREALRGPAGRQSRRSQFLQADFWTSASSNLKHNTIARDRLGMDDMVRSQTKWGAFGKKECPPHYWLEYLNCMEQRRMDVIEILHASGLRDAEAHDSNFASFYWNLSQNVSKEKHRTATAGIAGCVTPGGDLFLPHLGRPLLGCEKLLLQGIPYFSLALGNETEVQLGDLAGNAMSLTVVCATMLAAIIAPQLRKETEASQHKNVERILKESTLHIEELKSERLSLDSVEKKQSALDVFKSLAALARDAVASSIMCTCETSGQNTPGSHFLQCSTCRVSCCRDCCHTTAGYQLDSHSTFEMTIEPEKRSVAEFESRLRQILPPTLLFDADGLMTLNKVCADDVKADKLIGLPFSLHKIMRDRRKWMVTYYAKEFGVGQALAELKLVVGEVKTECIDGRDGALDQVGIGLLGELTSFLPAQSLPLSYGRLEPCAKIEVVLSKDGERAIAGSWMGKGKVEKVDLIIKGSDPGPSVRLQVGLNNKAAKGLKDHCAKWSSQKDFNAAKERGEERRWLYPENWKDWPGTITIAKTSGSMGGSKGYGYLYGVYKRSGCCHTINQNAMWIREGKGKSPALYVLLKPNISRTGPDVAIVTSSASHTDSASILAEFPLDWQPCDALNPKLEVVKNVFAFNWTDLPSFKCLVQDSAIEVTSRPLGEKCNILLKVNGLTSNDVSMLTLNGSDSDVVTLHLSRAQQSQQHILRAFNSICVSPILKHAAESTFPHDLSPSAEWIRLKPSSGSVNFGCCEKVIPRPPPEQWIWNQEREAWERYSEPGASRQYYQALQDAPETFLFKVDRVEHCLAIECHPEVAAHHASGNLIRGRGHGLEKDVSVHYRLSSLQSQADPVLTGFRVASCDSEVATEIELKHPHKLYERQKKAVTKMLAIERGERNFEEMEMCEHTMPGSAGWSLIAKATRNRCLAGGVIADAIGAGKTVVSIAIILSGIANARKSRKAPRKSSATLIVVPPGLIDQWKYEITKFTDALKVVCVYDAASLMEKPTKTMLEADCVICPVDILEAKGYLEHLRKVSGDEATEDSLKLPRYTGQVEKTNAEGVWIPSSSNDPYAGGNNPNNQRRRNESARYTYVYHKAIESLRGKIFNEAKKGVPLEYFEWERVIVDEIHECLCTSKEDLKVAKETSEATNVGFFQEKNRRAGREFLGITTKDVSRRPLVYRKSIFGLTGTPLLDSSNRVIELANLMGNTYVIGLSSHWRKLERESGRDIFLHNFLEPKQSREIRRNLYANCQEYLLAACCRNKSDKEMQGIQLRQHRKVAKMSKEEAKLYFQSQSGIHPDLQGFSIKVDDFDAASGHDISKFLRQNARMECRAQVLVDVCKEILEQKPTTKIVVFADGRIGGGDAARDALVKGGLGCTWLDFEDSVQERNIKLSWYQYGDVTEEDKNRPRVLVLHFEHAAGLNLQTECHNLILFSPLYIGEGGQSGDPVSDASTELQAIGRVYRPGQMAQTVNVYKIEVRGPNDEECLDGQLIRRNTDKETIDMAVNASDEAI